MRLAILDDYQRLALKSADWERLPNLKFIALTGLRAPSLDSQACSTRRVPISTTAAGRTSAT